MFNELLTGRIRDNYTLEEFTEMYYEALNNPDTEMDRIWGVFRTDLNIPAVFISGEFLSPQFDWNTLEGAMKGIKYNNEKLGVKSLYRHGFEFITTPTSPNDLVFDYRDVDPEILFGAVTSYLASTEDTSPLLLLMMVLHEMKSIITNIDGNQIINFSCDSFPISIASCFRMLTFWRTILDQLSYSIDNDDYEPSIESIYNSITVLKTDTSLEELMDHHYNGDEEK